MRAEEKRVREFLDAWHDEERPDKIIAIGPHSLNASDLMMVLNELFHYELNFRVQTMEPE